MTDPNEATKQLLDENAKLKQWVNDLLSGMYINCVYCGHRYGPRESTPMSMADVLKEHIEKCPEHPMSALKAKLDIMSDGLKLIRGEAAKIGHSRISVIAQRALKGMLVLPENLDD